MGSDKKAASIGLLVGMIILQIAVGIIGVLFFGIIGGLALRPFKNKWIIYVRAIYLILIAWGFVIACS